MGFKKIIVKLTKNYNKNLNDSFKNYKELIKFIIRQTTL